MKFFKSYSLFHKIFFLVFLILNTIVFIAPAFQQGGSWSSVFSFLSILGFIVTISGLFAGIYTARAEVPTYIWGTINVFFYIILSLSRHLYAEVILYTIYMLPMNIYGYFAWKKNAQSVEHTNTTSSTIEVKSLKKSAWSYIIILGIIIWVCYGTFVYYLPNIFAHFGMTIAPDKEFYIDSFTATVTIFAVIVSTKRFKETWYFWLVSDSVGVILYIVSIIQSGSFSFSALSGAIMWTQFVVNAIYGMMVWKKLEKK
ncbi:nicotinamide riboside transporter PnuC [Clostridium mediterraneense]|uniref:nicotinamide riboside transporter PnuC n=1 Tax=Clostridium mediterraneense TaxID=1805472 RepID=UPI00082C8600|nr:nicotinamide riboside transporter PnuC [Clostridium mediterraneense]